MGVGIGVGGPASEQAALLAKGERLAGEPTAGCPGQVAGRVDEHDPVLAGPPEELAGRLEPATPVGRLISQEGLDVADLGGRPVVLVGLVGDEAGEVADDADRLFDGDVSPGTGARPAGSLLGAHEMIGEGRHRRSERVGGGLDPALAATVGQAGVLVEAERQALADEELLQGAGERTGRASRLAGSLQHGLGMARLAVEDETADGADHQTCPLGAVALGGELGEAHQPLRWALQSGHQVDCLGDRARRAAGPAAMTHALALLAGKCSAGCARPRCQRRRRSAGARPAPAGV